MVFLLVFVAVLFRWATLGRLIGAKRMYLFDALMYAVFAAMSFAQPSPWPWLGYTIGCLCIFWAYSAGKQFLQFDELIKKAQEAENKQGKSDDRTTP